VKMGIKVAHVEAGIAQLRPHHAGGDQPARHRFDRRPALHALAGRRREPAAGGVAEGRIRLVGKHHDRFAGRESAGSPAQRHPRISWACSPGIFAFVTLHRPSNVDHREA